MNLADAIRRATARSGVFKEPKPLRPVNPPLDWPESKNDSRFLAMNGESRPSPGEEVDLAQSRAPEPPSHAIAGGNAIRIEMFLSGEQMTTMLKAIMAGQHTVLTLREAAAYLRLGSKALERLVEDGEIPALEIDGKYRFPKTNLDDWMAMKTATTEEKKDAA